MSFIGTVKIKQLYLYLIYAGLVTVLTIAGYVLYQARQQSLAKQINSITITDLTAASFQLAVVMESPQEVELRAGVTRNSLNQTVARNTSQEAARIHHFKVERETSSNQQYLQFKSGRQTYAVDFKLPAAKVQVNERLQEPVVLFGATNNEQGQPLTTASLLIVSDSEKPEVMTIIKDKLHVFPYARSTVSDSKGIWSFAYLPPEENATVHLQAITATQASGSLTLGFPLLTETRARAVNSNSYEVLGLRVGRSLTPEAEIYTSPRARELRLPDVEFTSSQSFKAPELPSAPTLTTTGNNLISPQAQLIKSSLAASGSCSSSNLGACKAGDSCSWQGGWEKVCLAPFTNEQGEEIKHEWVVYCGLDGKVEAGKYYSQLNPSCAAASTGQKKNNAILDDLCPGGSGKLKSDPGGCEPAGITAGGNNGGSASQVSVKFKLQTPLVQLNSQTPPQNLEPYLNIGLASGALIDSLANISAKDQAKTITLNAGQRLKLRSFYYPNNLSSNEPVSMTCSTVTITSDSADSVAPNAGEIYGTTAPGWAAVEAANGSTYTINLANCSTTAQNVEIGIPEADLPSGYQDGKFNITSAVINDLNTRFPNAVCPVDTPAHISQSFQGQAYDTSGAPTVTGNSHYWCDVRNQNPTDFKTTSTQPIYSSTNGVVKNIFDPIEAINYLGPDYCDGKRANGQLFYDGGFIVEIADQQGNLWRYSHLENIRIQEGQTISAGTVIGQPFDGEFSSVDTYNGLNLDPYDSQRSCWGSTHLHFSIIEASKVDSRSPHMFSGNTLNSTAFAIAKCNTNTSLILTSDGTCRNWDRSPDRIGTFKGLLQPAAADNDGLGVTLSTDFTPPTPGGYRPSINAKQSSTAEVVIKDKQVTISYFIDANNDGIRQTSESYLPTAETAAFAVEFSKVSELYEYKLQTGWNLIGFPFQISNLTKASQLHQAIAASSLAPRVSSQLIIATQASANNFNIYTVVANQNREITAEALLSVSKDFALTPGQGVFIYVPEALEFQLAGNTFSSIPKRDLWQGWNLLNLYELNQTKASSLLTGEKLEAVNITQVARYENGRFRILLTANGQTFGEDFTLDQTKSYFIFQQK